MYLQRYGNHSEKTLTVDQSENSSFGQYTSDLTLTREIDLDLDFSEKSNFNPKSSEVDCQGHVQILVESPPETYSNTELKRLLKHSGLSDKDNDNGSIKSTSSKLTKLGQPLPGLLDKVTGRAHSSSTIHSSNSGHTKFDFDQSNSDMGSEILPWVMLDQRIATQFPSVFRDALSPGTVSKVKRSVKSDTSHCKCG